MSRLPWIEKYRPASLDEIIDHDEKITTLKRLVDNFELTHLLLVGPPGTGKTSMIINLARYMYGKKYRSYIMDINGSSERGIDIIRTQVLQFIQTKSDKVKLVILDEADALTSEAQNALKSVIEKYSKFVRFCLICNDGNKILSALHSRCTRLVFTHLSRKSVKQRAIHIIENENLNMTEEALDGLIENETDFRQILNILQGLKAFYNEKTITIEDLYKYIGKTSKKNIDKIIKILFSEKMDKSIDDITTSLQSGEVDLLDLIYEINKKVISIDLEPKLKALIFMSLSDIELKIHSGCNNVILICLLVSVFQKVRNEIKS
jgi:replication factor C subunit 3/5